MRLMYVLMHNSHVRASARAYTGSTKAGIEMVNQSDGSKKRGYPAFSLDQGIKVASAIAEGASGMPVGRLTLAKLLDIAPGSSNFRDLLICSRAYGLTEGGANADQFALTELGIQATSADEVERQTAMRRAVVNLDPTRLFVNAFMNKKIPAAVAFKEFLTRTAKIAPEWTDDCIQHILKDLRTAGLVHIAKGGGEYIQAGPELPESLSKAATEASLWRQDEAEGSDNPATYTDPMPGVLPPTRTVGAESASPTSSEATVLDGSLLPGSPRKVFIAHGKNRGPLEQLKKILDLFKVPYAVAIDEPNRGRPISAKVAELMRSCASAIFIFTADEKFIREGDDGSHHEIWRPSENVIYELGAAAVLYGRRIVIFKESGVTFPSDFSDLGYTDFDPGELDSRMGNLLGELVALDILEVRAKG